MGWLNELKQRKDLSKKSDIISDYISDHHSAKQNYNMKLSLLSKQNQLNSQKWSEWF